MRPPIVRLIPERHNQETIMSTRGVIGFRLRETDYLTYNHSDSYPGYLGQKAVEFINWGIKEQGYDNWLGTLKQRVGNMLRVDNDIPPTEEQKKLLAQYTNTRVGKQSTDDWYCLLRDTQGTPENILAARFFEPYDDYMLDSLFCEWAYVLNLDTEELEVYKGFQPVDGDLPGRYRKLPLPPVPDHQTKHEYGAVALNLTIPFKAIAQADIEKMVDAMDSEDVERTADYIKQLGALAAAFS